MENNLVSKSKLVEKGKQNNQVEWEKNNADVTLCHEEEEKIVSQSDKLHKILPQSLVLLKDEKVERIKQMISMCLTSKYFNFVEGHPIMLTLP